MPGVAGSARRRAVAQRAGTYLEGYYAAAVRSMSMSWHNFFLGAFDPVATVTLDKLPGAFWVQALSVRAFGVHTWAIVLPQVVEGVLPVLVLYRIVRRLCGPAAGLLAAIVLVLSPATVALDRGNISDTLMVLFLLLAADSVVVAVTAGRWSSTLLAGFWVGLAFQAKMIEAWIVLPALGLVYLVAAAGTWWRRLVRIAALGAVAALVSLSWMTVVTLTPASSRPYVDGSQDNSLFQQVCVYNGVGRLDQASPNQLLTRSIGIDIPPSPPPAWDRLLTGAFGRDIGWLMPAALIALVAGLVGTRRNPRSDPTRAGLVLWGAWLLALTATFSFSSSIISYYTAALSPPIAGLIASGSVLAWRWRHSMWVRATVAATVVVSVTYAAWLLAETGTGVSGWLAPGVLAVGAVACVGLVLSWWNAGPRLFLRVGPAFHHGGPAARAGTGAAGSALPDGHRDVRPGRAAHLRERAGGAAYRGYTGTIPEPTLATLESMIRAVRFHLVLQSPSATDPRLVWIAHHCLSVPQPTGVDVPSNTRYAIYYCLRTS